MKLHSLWLGLTTALSATGVLFHAADAHAQDYLDDSRYESPGYDRSPKPGSLDDEDFRPWDHGEFTMGFIGGQRSYTQTNFSQVGSGERLNLDAPLSGAPYDRVAALGLRYDARLVVSYVRMTVGFDLPFATYSTGDSTQTYDIAGQQREVTSRSLDIKGLRFGIGGELPTGSPITPFVDVMGTVNFLDTTLVVDDESYDFDATSFGFSVRGGVRLQVRRWFFAQLAGEVGIASDVVWGGELSVGFSTM
ncbi:MAG: hypothetical protein H6718_17860 [Polyangiaceae bacterium]|nr:hypothetical protein [Myxococcales bacterium]MCB9587270.1 hypothetical protein [Polyangiaceae bacterium]MCB9605933.1 hypothetical protein [Polyangiaceae bacterium]